MVHTLSLKKSLPICVFFSQLFHQFIAELQHTSVPEFIAVVCGIVSVYYSRSANILVYPVGIVSTSIFIYLYIAHGLYADASVNLYYTIMSIIGMIMWTRKGENDTLLQISLSTRKEHLVSVVFFLSCWIVLYLVLKAYTDSTVPYADSFTSAAAFTGMWLMNKKKVANWFWWVVTNIASIPLNYYKGLAFTSFQYMVLLVLAIMGWRMWWKKLAADTQAIKG